MFQGVSPSPDRFNGPNSGVGLLFRFSCPECHQCKPHLQEDTQHEPCRSNPCSRGTGVSGCAIPQSHSPRIKNVSVVGYLIDDKIRLRARMLFFFCILIDSGFNRRAETCCSQWLHHRPDNQCQWGLVHELIGYGLTNRWS